MVNCKPHPDVDPGVSDADLVEIATEFRKGLLGNQSSQWRCAMVSWPLAGLLRSIYDVDCECVESDLGHCNHVWIKLADGRALDATADQFNHFNDCDFPPVYLGPRVNIHGVLPGDPNPSVAIGSALYAGGAE